MKVMKVIICGLFFLLAITLGVKFLKFMTVYIVVVAVIICAIAIFYDRYILNILNWQCDPLKYRDIMQKRLARYEKRNIEGTSRALTMLNLAVANMCLDEDELALSQLLQIDKTVFKMNSVYEWIYYLDLICCYYSVGKIDEAEELYATEMIRNGASSKARRLIVDILIGERYYYLKQYDKSYEQLSKLLGFDLNKRQYLEILYKLAQMDEVKGDIELATKRYTKVVNLGNKLGIVKDAKERLEQLNNENSQI